MNIISEEADGSKPTADDIQKLAPFTNLGVGNQSTVDWYCLTHKCQGSFTKVLESGYMLKFTDDPTKKENWDDFGYVLNFDNNSFDFYQSHALKESFPLSTELLPKWKWDEESYVRQMAQIEEMQMQMAANNRRFN